MMQEGVRGCGMMQEGVRGCLMGTEAKEEAICLSRLALHRVVLPLPQPRLVCPMALHRVVLPLPQPRFVCPRRTPHGGLGVAASTEEGCAHANIRCPVLDRGRKVGTHPHAPFWQLEGLCKGCQIAEERFGIVVLRRKRHQPDNPKPQLVATELEQLGQVIDGNAALLGLVALVHLDEVFPPDAEFGLGGGKGLGKARPVEAMDYCTMGTTSAALRD